MKTQTKEPRVAQSLTTTLGLAFFTVSVVALLISGGLQLFFHLHTHQTLMSVNQQLIAQEAARAVSSFMQEKLSILKIAAWLTNLDAVSPAEQKEILFSLLGHQPAFRQVLVFNPQGHVVTHASRLSLGESRRIIDRLKEVTPCQTPQMSKTVSPVYIDPVTSEPMVVMTVPMIDVFGDFKGTLLAEVNLKFMWDLVSQLKVGETGHAYVVDRCGNLIAFSDTARVLRGENVADLPVVNEFIHHPVSASKTWVSSYRGISGATAVGTYVPLETPDWAVVTELPWAEAYREIIWNVVVSIGITLAMAVLAGLLGRYIARRLAAPLVNLTTTATRIAGGERELQTVVRGPREVASLAMAFNSMTTQLRQILEGLEQQIAERKRTEAALKESEYLLRKSQAVARVGSYYWDTRTGKWMSSQTLDEILGIDDHYLKDLSGWVELVHPEQQEEMSHYLNNHVLTEHNLFEKTYRIIRHNDRQERWVFGLGEIEFDAKRHPIKMIGTIQDITERHRAEDVLKKNQRLLDKSQRLAHIGSWDLDIKTHELIWSDEVFRIFGLSPQEFRPTFEDFVNSLHPDDRGMIPEHHRETLETKKFRTFDYRIVRPDGTLRWIHATGEVYSDSTGIPVRIIGTLQDFTERKKAEEALWESEVRFREMAENIHEVFWLFDWGEQRVIYVSPAYEEIWGRSIQALYDQYTEWSESIHPDDRAYAEASFARILETDEGDPREYRIIRPDGTIRWISDRGVTIRGKQGQVKRIAGIAEDITGRKRTEGEREQLITELETKNAELERFTYTVSHDLKSPLVTVQGFLGFLEQDAIKGDMERLQSDIRHIRDATETMHHLLNDLLELSRIGRVINPPEDVPFGELVQEAIKRVARQITARDVHVATASDFPPIQGDRRRLIEVVQNLLENAIKFMGEQPEPRIEIGSKSVGHDVVFYVADNGMGIDPRYHETVFGLFERLDPSVEGTGVGLSLVKRIIEVHGGRIWVESDGPGQGSTFCFTVSQASGGST